MKTVLIICLVFFYCYGPFVEAQNTENNVTAKERNDKWIEDLDYLAEQMPNVHINLFHSMTKEQFETYVSGLRKQIPDLRDEQIIVNLIKLVAMVGDGHTILQPESYKVFPVNTFIFKDGQYVIWAYDEYKDLIGMKLVKIGNTNLDEVYKIISPLIPHDNKIQIKAWLPFYMIISGVLNGTGIIKDENNAQFTFEDNKGNQKTVILKPVEFGSYIQKLHSRPVPENTPLYRSNQEKFYWFKYLDDSKTLYFQYNVVQNDPNDSITSFIKRLGDFTDNHVINRFIVDIRNNGGGNLFTSKPFTDFIMNNPKINQRGKLFVIIGRGTFSAASYFTTSMEYKTKAIFFGEPTAASPNHYGDPQRIVLPNSRIEIKLSTFYWQNSFPFDNRKWTSPDVTVELTSKDYFDNRDPVLDAILKYKIKPLKTIHLNDDEINKMTGRFEYEPDRVLDIINGSDGLEFEITDFIKSGLYPVSKYKYKTDINNVELSFENGDFNNVILNAGGTELKLKRLPAGYKTSSELISAGNFDEAAARLRNIKQQYPGNKIVSESSLNNLGYQLLGEKKYEGAITIFKLNVELYPGSFNTYDSLGEAYMISGNNELAIENYEKSIELNSNNENGKRILKKLQENK